MSDQDIPVEIRIWMPVGTVKVRAYLENFTADTAHAPIERDFGAVHEYNVLPPLRTYSLKAHGPSWKMDRHGRPVPR